MNNILFILGSFLPEPSANGICASEIINKLRGSGCDITVLSINNGGFAKYEQIDGVWVYRIKENPTYTRRFRSKHPILSQMCRNADHIWSLLKLIGGFPVSLRRNHQYMRMAEKLIVLNGIDTVISVVRPVETLSIIPQLKKAHPKVHFVSYNLDILQEKHFSISLIDQLYQRRIKQFYLRTMSCCDCNVLMEYAKKQFQSEIYSSLSASFLYADLPLLHKMTVSGITEKDMLPEKINIVYTGSLSEQLRNPAAVLSLFSELKSHDFVLHFYSKGCEKQLLAAKQVLQDKLVLHGYVEPERAYAAIEGCDYLLNISNHAAYLVPSKIFEYFATGKPIINILSTHTDPAMPYYERYANILNLFTCDSEEDAGLKLQNFLFCETHKQIPFEVSESVFRENTPEYFVQILQKRMNEVKL